jgi:hypothetical protein
LKIFERFAFLERILRGNEVSMNPDPEIDPVCRAKKADWVASDEFAVCQTNNPLCPHLVVNCGYRLCFHPGRDQIIAQTRLMAGGGGLTGKTQRQASRPSNPSP